MQLFKKILLLLTTFLFAVTVFLFAGCTQKPAIDENPPVTIDDKNPENPSDESTSTDKKTEEPSEKKDPVIVPSTGEKPDKPSQKPDSTPSGGTTDQKDPEPNANYYFDPNIIDVPEGDDYYKIVINKNYQLPKDFKPAELEVMYKSNYKLEKTACEHLTVLLKDMEKEGLSVYPASGFRTELFNRKVFTFKETYGNQKSESEIIDLAASIVAIPGSSEHQTGLAVDLTKSGSLEQSFGDTKEGIWLAENCHKYGFIIRYPKDKEDVTTITYEPWHLRYVGISLAEEIKNSGKCLEEYFDCPAISASAEK